MTDALVVLVVAMLAVSGVTVVVRRQRRKDRLAAESIADPAALIRDAAQRRLPVDGPSTGAGPWTR